MGVAKGVSIVHAMASASNGPSSDERILETIFNPEHPIVGEFWNNNNNNIDVNDSDLI